MIRHSFAILLGVLAAAPLTTAPAAAGELKPEEARRFVSGKLFAFNCFEGTRGAGRINGDGSVAGTIQFRGAGPTRYVAMPAGTLRVKGEKVCASVRGMPIEPCFNLDQKDQQSFRGSIAGLGFAYCDFTRRSGRSSLMRASLSHPAAPATTQSTVATAVAHD